ncbi:MAG: hypothetical protein PHG69_01015, partial [Candidatus Omnitrophica bacterium]|nr:hypothetical protein [Candidatus Omnitrophota bacterium]
MKKAALIAVVIGIFLISGYCFAGWEEGFEGTTQEPEGKDYAYIAEPAAEIQTAAAPTAKIESKKESRISEAKAEFVSLKIMNEELKKAERYNEKKDRDRDFNDNKVVASVPEVSDAITGGEGSPLIDPEENQDEEEEGEEVIEEEKEPPKEDEKDPPKDEEIKEEE